MAVDKKEGVGGRPGGGRGGLGLGLPWCHLQHDTHCIMYADVYKAGLERSSVGGWSGVGGLCFAPRGGGGGGE